MDLDKRIELYEKMYNQEVERREKINTRLNVPLAIFITIIGLLAFLLQNKPMFTNFLLQMMFWLLFLAASSALGFAFWYFRKGAFGHTDQLMPTAKEMEKYHQELAEYYGANKDEGEVEAANVDQAFKAFLLNGYMSYSTNNAINNEARSYNIYRATASITIAALFAFAAFIPFYIEQKPKKYNQNQLIEELIKMTEQTNQPKPMPVPPGPRNVKGEVPIPKRQPSEQQNTSGDKRP